MLICSVMESKACRDQCRLYCSLLTKSHNVCALSSDLDCLYLPLNHLSNFFFFLNKISLNQPRCHSDNIAISRKPKRRDATQVHLSWLVFEVCLLGKLWSVLVIHPAFMLDYCRHFTTAAVYIDTAGICCVRWPVEILAALLVKTKQKLLRKVKYPTTSFLIWLLLLLHPTKMV